MAAVVPILAAHNQLTRTEVETISSPMKDEIEDGPVQNWTVGHVHRWLCEIGKQDVASQAKNKSVDGGVLLELDHGGWEELGVSSKIEQARMLSEVQKCLRRARSLPPPRGGVRQMPPSPAPQGVISAEPQPVPTEREVWRRCGSPFQKVTPEQGAEHEIHWTQAIARANAKGENVKGHALRFLGMYNVMDLLTFTIAMDILATADPPAEEDSPWVNVFILVFAAQTVVLSGLGMWLSTITYNSASAVHDHNFITWLRLPAVNRAFKICNDCGVMATCNIVVTGGFLIAKVAFVPFDANAPTAITVTMVVLNLLMLLYLAKEFFGLCTGGGAGSCVPLMTNAALFGGLMGDQPVCPDGVEDGEAWARAASTEELMRCVYGNLLERTKSKDKKTCVPPTLDEYAAKANEYAARGIGGLPYASALGGDADADDAEGGVAVRPDGVVASVLTVLAEAASRAGNIGGGMSPKGRRRSSAGLLVRGAQ